MDSVKIVVCSLRMSKVMRGSGYVVTSVMGGIASFATSFLPRTMFLMSTVAQSARKQSV